MKYFVWIFLMSLVTFSAAAQQAEFEWAMKCGNPPNTTDVKTSIAAAADGSFYLAGEFVDTASFGNKNIISSGGTDVFLVKHNNEGHPIWEARIGAADYDYVQQVAVSNSGNVIVAGYFYGATMIGTDRYTSYGSQDIFVASFDSLGNFLWSERAGGGMADYISSVDIDPDNNIYISGYFYNDIAIGDTVLSASASSDIYIAKYTPDGELQWAMSAGGSSSDQVRSVSCDHLGNVYFAGSFYYDFSIGDTTLNTSNPVGVVVGRVNGYGQPEMALQLNGTYLTPDVFVKAGQDGAFYLAGNFSEELYLGDSTFTAGPFNQDVFAAKLGHSGEVLWASHGHSFSSDQVIGIDLDGYDNLYLTGHYLDHIHFEALTLNYTLCCGSREVFIVSYTFDGKVNWGKQISGARTSVQAAAMESTGDLVLSGMFSDTVSFDNLNLINYSSYKNYVTCLHKDLAVGIQQIIPSANDFLVYPNPAVESISLAGRNLTDLKRVDVYSQSGELVLSDISGRSENINISRLSHGLYYIRVTIEGNRVFSGEFIKH